MAIKTATIQVRMGLESELDISKAVPGEWLLSTDTKYIRMCVAYGIVLRMATYEAFEADMAKIKELVSTAQSVKSIVMGLASEVGSKTTIVLEATEEAKAYMEEAKKYSELAFATTPDGYEVLVNDVNTLKESITQTSSRTHTGSYAGGEKLIGIKGASEQKQYSGAQLLTYPYYDTSKTESGVTWEVEREGCISGSGVATALTSLNLAKRSDLDGTYTFSIGKNHTNILGLIVMYDDTGAIISEKYFSDNSYTFTVDKDEVATVILGVKRDNNTTVSGVIIPQLEVGEVATPWEPYVGNAPSPSPSYPQTIEHSGDSVNLFDYDTYVANGNQITFDVIGGRTLYRNANLSVTSKWTVYDKDGNSLGTFADFGFTNTNPLVLPQNASYVTVVGDKVLEEIYIGYNSDATYRPYGYGLVIKQVGKNQFDMSQLKNANCVENNGVYSGIISSLYSVFRSGFIVPKLKENTQYTISLYGYVSMDGATPRVYVRYADASEAVIAINIKDTSMTEYTYTTREGMTVSDIYFGYGAEGQETVYLKDFQIEEGDTATAYEPYQSNTIDIPLNEPLRGIDDCKDGFVFKYERWRIERNCYGFWLNGSENWQINDYNNSYYSDIVNGITASGVITKMLSDSYIFTTEASSQMADKTIKTSWSGETSLIILRDTSYANVAELKAGLAKNPVFCVVKRAEPIYEDIEDQTPFYNFKSYDTVTYISTDSKVEPEVIVKYGKTEVGALTLENYNRTKLNEIRVSATEALLTELSAALVAGSEV